VALLALCGLVSGFAGVVPAPAPRPGPAVAAAAPAGPPVPASGAFYGAFPDPDATGQTPATVTTLEAAAGRKLDVDRIYADWSTVEPDPQTTWDVANGIIPLISIDPFDGNVPIPWAQIASGAQDPAIIAQAQGLASLHAPILLSFSHEAEGDTANGTAAEFVAAWRHYFAVFEQYDPDVASVLILDAYQYGRSGISQWYPGDAYVDWVGGDGYNYFNCHDSSWVGFRSIFAPLNTFAVAHDKPEVIAEWASVEDPSASGRKAAWITAAGQTMTRWSHVKAASYFDSLGPDRACDFPLTSSTSAMQAFADLGAETYFNTRPAAALSASPAVGPAPLAVTLDTAGTAGSLNPIASWTLQFGDGASDTGTGTPPATIVHTYAVGTFAAVLSVVGTTGQTDEATASVQTTPPAIAHPWHEVTSTTSASLGAEVDPEGLRTAYAFSWSATPDLENATPASAIGAGTQYVSLRENLAGLHPGTLYYWRLRATSAAGTVTTGPLLTFETEGRAPTVSVAAATLNSPTWPSTVTLTGTVNPRGVDTQWYFEYGTTSSYGSVSPATEGDAGDGTSPVAVSTTIGSLAVATTYHYALVAVNAVAETVSADRDFKTLDPPVVGHEAVTAKTSTSATVFATVDAEGQPTTYRFRWGTGPSLAHTTGALSDGSGSAEIKRTRTLTGLTPGTTYEWEVVAKNSAGTTTGEVEHFSTPKAGAQSR
jgi:hypothetical protein